LFATGAELRVAAARLKQPGVKRSIMQGWHKTAALVTGAASGIGLALSKAVANRGATVWMTDIDALGVERAAKAVGANAHAAALDVRDAEAVREMVERVVGEHGRIDYLFNNAGIGLGGEAHELTAAHYDRIIDINIRGVVHGITAAYPIMIKQRSGHIVNTASMAGLVPAPLIVPYVMTKHAVVGLSLGLRAEAAGYGVRVSALCPSAVETPILDSETPHDLPAPSWRPNVRRYLTSFGGAPYPVDKLAEDTIRGVERNVPLIITPTNARIGAFLYRLFPGLVTRQFHKALATELADRPRRG
jgi:NAD(P)-dependent dehydrogenase (short-subunit alcohol dehydrogenase family)